MKLTLEQLIYLPLILTLSAPDLFADVPHTFESGTPALASEVNENFSDLDTRVTSVENQSPGPDFSGFGLPFSADGAPKNVIVLNYYDQDLGETIYALRIRYANSTDTVSVNGTPTIRPFIASYPTVVTDNTGQIISVRSYIDTPDAENYQNYYIEVADYDPDGTNKQIYDDTSVGTESCVGGASRICMGSTTSSSPAIDGNWWHNAYNRAVTNNYILESNGWNFDQVTLEVRTTGGDERLRIRAKGIGLIFQRYGNYNYGSSDPSASAIYYRVNGETRGSLAGTPFDVGQPLHGLFF